jgi:uncharacterized alkaline shock family protein YloU
VSQDPYVVEAQGGTIRIEADALARLVVSAVEHVDGARVRRPRRGLDVEVDGGRARVSVEVAARYGTVLPELAGAVQRSVAAALARSAGLTVESVDVAIEELER